MGLYADSLSENQWSEDQASEILAGPLKYWLQYERNVPNFASPTTGLKIISGKLKQ